MHLTHKLYSVFPDKHDAKTISLFSLHTNERQPEILQLESQAVCYPLKTPFTSEDLTIALPKNIAYS